MKLTTPLFLLSCITISSSVNAGWSGTTFIEQLNVGTNGANATGVVLQGYVAADSGCTVPSVIWFDGNDANYDAFLSTLLATKFAGTKIRIRHSGCTSDGKFPVAREIIVDNN